MHYHHRIPAASLLALLLFFSGAVHCTQNIEISPSMNGLYIYEKIEFIEDRSGTLTLEEVVDKGGQGFQRSEAGIFNFPLSEHDYWFRFSIHNPSGENINWLLEFNLEFIDAIDIYAINQHGQSKQLSFSEKAQDNPGFSNYRHPLASMHTSAGETEHYYLHLKRQRVSPISLSSLRLWDHNSFQYHSAEQYSWLGLFYGGMLIAMLYNFVLFIFMRERTYLYYVLYILVSCTSWFTQNGLAQQYLWQESALLTNYSSSFFALLATTFGSLYTRSFLDTIKHAPWIDRYILIIVSSSLLGILLLPFISLSTGNLIAYLLIALPVSTYPFIGAYVWYRGYSPARIFTIAWFFFGFGTLAFVLVHMGTLPNTATYSWAGQTGAWFEAILLSIALSDRLRLIKNERSTAQKRYQELLVSNKLELEKKVAHRTADLALAKEEAERLAHTDSLTRLPNRRCFFKRAEQEHLRSQRFNHALSLFILDIDLFKTLNDRFGHAFGDQVLQSLSNTIRECLRDSDIVGRIGGEEFAAVLPQTNIDKAHEIAERLRQLIAQIDFMVDGQKVNISVSIGLAALHEGEELSPLMARADAILYQAKQSGRNRVICAA